MSLPAIHCVVAEHDAEDKLIVASNGAHPMGVEIAASPGTVFHDVWSSTGAYASVGNMPDPSLGLLLPPLRHGMRIRSVDIPPDSVDYLAHGSARMQAAYAQIGARAESTVTAVSMHPLMHRNESVDDGIVSNVEMTLVLDDSEVLVKTRSVIMQRGANHTRAKRSGRPSRMLVVLVDGRFDVPIADTLARR
jgi:hypothetical protein